jgi:hypothetical protein
VRIFSDRRLVDARLIVSELVAGGATGLNKQVREEKDRLLVRSIPLQLAPDLSQFAGHGPQPAPGDHGCQGPPLDAVLVAASLSDSHTLGRGRVNFVNYALLLG